MIALYIAVLIAAGIAAVWNLMQEGVIWKPGRINEWLQEKLDKLEEWGDR